MSTHLPGAFLGVLFSLVAVAASAAPAEHIHGRIVAIDAKRGTFQIHHDPFPAMPMEMTMEAQPKRRSDLSKLHVGEVIDATIDPTADPWSVWNIRPASVPARAR
jgi:Cu/Ag efflux protein CusF